MTIGSIAIRIETINNDYVVRYAHGVEDALKTVEAFERIYGVKRCIIERAATQEHNNA